MINKEQTNKPDFMILWAAGAVLILGLMILSSASAMISQVKYGDSYYLIRHQLLFGIIPGLVVALITYKMPLKLIRKLSPVLLLLSVLLLLIVFVPGVGFSSGGAQRWIHLGFVTVQPSEILKLTFIIYLASWLASRAEAAKKNRNSSQEFQNTLVAFAAVMGLIGFLLLKQPDMSTFGIIAVAAAIMYFLAGTPLKHSVFIAVAGIILLAVLVYFTGYRSDRFFTWLNPEKDPLGKGFQSSQALIIIGSGGVFGEGFGSSSQKYASLPELIGDSIFAPYAHELGFIGGAVLVALFILFAWRGFVIARARQSKFEYLAVLGITFWIVTQAMINIASATRLIPLSGIPLPFVSYGGTAMIVSLGALGLILNISRQNRA